MHDHRHVQTGVVRPAFAPRHTRAVIAVVQHDRVVGQAVGLEFGKDAPHLHIHLGKLVVVLGPVATHLRRVRMVRRDAHLGRVMHGRMRSAANLALVTHREVENGEERLARFAVSPVGLPARVIPDLTRLDQVVILLAVVRAVIASFAKVLRIQFHVRRKSNPASHVLGSCRRRIEARDNRRPRRRADRSGRPRIQIAHPPGGEAIQIGRCRVRVPVRTQMRAVVFARDPKDIRSAGVVCGHDSGAQKRRHACTQA